MGFFKKLNKAVGLGKNNDLIRIGAAVGTGGMSEVAHAASGGSGGIQDMLLGKKSKDIGPDAIANQIRETQSKGIGELNAALDTPAENIVRQGIESQKKGLLTSAQDARRKAQEMIARQGLKGSSIGLGLNRSIDQQLGDSVADLNAREGGLIRNQKLQDAATRIGVGGINQGGINFNTIEGQRSGGLLGIASAVAPVAGGIGQAMGGYAALKRAGG